MSGNGRHRRPRQAPAIVVAAGVTGSAIAIPLLASASASAADASTWDKVAACESGGDWSANLNNGYYGGLQIGEAAWNQYGGHEYAKRPDLASRSHQIAVAEKILAAEGSQTWSSCADEAGLPSTEPSAGSGGYSLGDTLSGLLGGSRHGSGYGSLDDSSDQSGSGTQNGSTDEDPSGGTDATDPSGTTGVPSPSATDDSLGDALGLGGTATASPDLSTTPSGTASPDASGSPQHPGQDHHTGTGGGKHRGDPGGAASDATGFPPAVSDNNGGDLASSGSATGGAGSIGNADLPGVVPDTGAASPGTTPAVRIPFAPQDPSHPHAGGPYQGSYQSPWQFPDEAAWAGAGTGARARPAGTPAGMPSPAATQGATHPATPGVTHPSDPTASGSGGKHRGGAASETPAHASSDASSHDVHAPGATGGEYTVRAGDSLSGIAASRHVDGGWRALYAANKDALGSDPNHIVPGQTLQLGGK